MRDVGQASRSTGGSDIVVERFPWHPRDAAWCVHCASYFDDSAVLRKVNRIAVDEQQVVARRRVTQHAAQIDAYAARPLASVKNDAVGIRGICETAGALQQVTQAIALREQSVGPRRAHLAGDDDTPRRRPICLRRNENVVKRPKVDLARGAGLRNGGAAAVVPSMCDT